jgi:NADPH-dependent curcumin reductase CurA
VLPLLNTYAGIPVSRLIAQYNGVGPGNGTDRLPATMREILSKSLTLRGFINSAADVEATLSPENSREYRKARPALMLER